VTRDELIDAICETLELLADDPEIDGRMVRVRKDFPEKDIIHVTVGYNEIELKVLD
jgi:hypothetical protein